MRRRMYRADQNNAGYNRMSWALKGPYLIWRMKLLILCKFSVDLQVTECSMK